VKPNALYLPLAGLYGAVVALRNLFFDSGIFRATRVGLPVVSVGNVRAGGTGKTPFVVLVAQMLSARGLRVGVVARGYGRIGEGRIVVGEHPDVRRVGDEPAMMARSVQGTVVVDDSKRNAARWVASGALADVIIVDDGFQHRWLARDLDIVLVGARELEDNERLLPAGYAREPRSALRRAHLVVVTGCRSVEELETARTHLAWLKDVPTIGVKLVATEVVDAATKAVTDLRNRRVVALSGIGNPASFERTLQELGADVAAHRSFADHHWFTSQELASVEQDRVRLRAERVVTTEKDFVRIAPEDAAALALLSVVRVRQEIIDGEQTLHAQLGRIAEKAAVRE